MVCSHVVVVGVHRDTGEHFFHDTEFFVALNIFLGRVLCAVFQLRATSLCCCYSYCAVGSKSSMRFAKQIGEQTTRRNVHRLFLLEFFCEIFSSFGRCIASSKISHAHAFRKNRFRNFGSPELLAYSCDVYPSPSLFSSTIRRTKSDTEMPSSLARRWSHDICGRVKIIDCFVRFMSTRLAPRREAVNAR